MYFVLYFIHTKVLDLLQVVAGWRSDILCKACSYRPNCLARYPNLKGCCNFHCM